MAPLGVTLTTTWLGRARIRSTAGIPGRGYEDAGGGCDGAGIGAVADGELQAVRGDQLLGGGLVVHRQRDEQPTDPGEAVQGPLEGA